MEKLTIEHVAPYLPYVLFGTFLGTKDIVTKIELEHKIISSLNNGNVLINDFKPILHPLSDLKYEIRVTGKKAVVANKLAMINYGFAGHHPPTGDQIKEKIKNGTLTFNDSKILFEWHFDVFRLIEKRLAIDINTL